MVIVFKTAKLRKDCSEEKLLIKKHGSRRAELLKMRLNQIGASNNLEDLKKLPQLRCHELKGDRKGQLSVDLDHPYRLILEPANNPLPKKRDGGLDWAKVTEIMGVGIEDTHE
jgi:plasmid maintenance system killer protein